MLGGFLITHFQLNRPPEPVTVPVAHASPEMMQLLRDEHGLIGSFVKARIANEKNAFDKSVNEKEQQRASADDSAAPVPVEAQPGVVAAPRPTAIVAVVPGKPAAARVKPPVVSVAASACKLASPAERKRTRRRRRRSNDDSLLAKDHRLQGQRGCGHATRRRGDLGGIPS